MNEELGELWQAMKDTKYSSVLKEIEDLSKKTLDVDSMLRASLNIVVEAVHAEVGTLWYYDCYGTGKIHPKAFYGGKEISNYSIGLGEGVAGTVVKNAKSIIVPDCKKDKNFSTKIDFATGFNTKTMICVPLCNKQKNFAFGSIQIINKKDNTLFDYKDLDFIETLAEKISVEFNKVYSGVDTSVNLYTAIKNAFGNKKKDDILRGIKDAIKDTSLSKLDAFRISCHFSSLYDLIKKEKKK